MLTLDQIAEVDRLQTEQQRRIRELPEDGIKVTYRGKSFIVHTGVFIPFADTELLLDNYTINEGEEVLDVGTGCGIIAIMSAYKGAGEVIATDISKEAINCAKSNVSKHGFVTNHNVRGVYVYSLPSNVYPEGPNNDILHKRFDVITGNLPFRNKQASDYVEATQWDTDLKAQEKFFSELDFHLKQNGRVYTTQSNFGALDEMLLRANHYGFQPKLIGAKQMPSPDPRVLYAFELKRK